jgi:hypothetical protein
VSRNTLDSFNFRSSAQSQLSTYFFPVLGDNQSDASAQQQTSLSGSLSVNGQGPIQREPVAASMFNDLGYFRHSKRNTLALIQDVSHHL